MTQTAGRPEATTSSRERVQLKRSLTLPLIVLYGLGVTIGAGIYVLVGATAGVAGGYAPLSFVLAALVMLPSACSFAELVGRLPVSAGEAAYVRAGLKSETLSVIVGLLVVCAGTVSASAICLGSVGYIRQFIDVSGVVLVPIIVVLITFIAAWGVRESVTFAAVMTVIEIVGLLAVIAGGLLGGTGSAPVTSVAPAASVPLVDGATLMQIGFGVMGGGVLAFFAFIGFEDLVNMAEETEDPGRIMPRAIFLTLIVSTTLYVLVATVAVLNVPVGELAGAEAPLSLVFERTTGASPATISLIAIIATLNGVIVQIIMGARVIYGLSQQGSLPELLGYVHPVTRTPVIATALIGMIVIVLATFVPLKGLAELTSQITLTVFAMVNLSLWNIHRRGDPAPEGVFANPRWVPVVGLICCGLFLVVGLL
jgi:amino acid transporter